MNGVAFILAPNPVIIQKTNEVNLKEISGIKEVIIIVFHIFFENRLGTVFRTVEDPK